jgi:type IV pilus assembly protein PilA
MFLQNLRAKVGARLSGEGEAGFTLIELLVVMLILGILAAIALPAFFNQKEKAGDAKAKETAHTAQVALETYATDNGGSYAGATLEDLHEIEPTIIGEGLGEESPVTLEGLGANAYTIKVDSTTGNWFKVVNAGGSLSWPCEEGGKGGCPVGGWGG